MEYAEGGDLFDAIQKRHNGVAHNITSSLLEEDEKLCGMNGYTEAECAKITSQVLSALVYLHDRNIVHKDIKPENVLLHKPDVPEEDLCVKLSDFGLAQVVPHQNQFDAPYVRDNHKTEQPSTYSTQINPVSSFTSNYISSSIDPCDADYYTAPEISRGEKYDTKADVYSLGVTLHILLCGIPPVPRVRNRNCSLDDESDCASNHSPENEDDEYYQTATSDLCDVEFPANHWYGISSLAQSFVKEMLNSDKKHRISAKEALEHEWIHRFTSIEESSFALQ